MVNTTLLKDTDGNVVGLKLRPTPGNDEDALIVEFVFPEGSSNVMEITRQELVSAAKASSPFYHVEPRVWLNSDLFPRAKTEVTDVSPKLRVTPAMIELGRQQFHMHLNKLMVSVDNENLRIANEYREMEY